MPEALLALYGLLPIVQGTVAGIESVPRSVREAAEGLGMGAARILRRVEVPLAKPVIVAGIRTSVIINIGTAALASTVGAKGLGTPIVVGLTGFNTAYIMESTSHRRPTLKSRACIRQTVPSRRAVSPATSSS